MAHLRQSIRDIPVTAVTDLSTTGSNVFHSGVYPLGTNKLSALFQLDDQLKPEGYDTPAECWVRTTAMIREVAMRANMTYASAVYVQQSCGQEA